MEDLADLVADGVVDALHVELGGERLLHAVDDRELGGALLALLEQALRLVEEARVLQRDAHAVGKRLQQAHVRVAERVLALHVDQVDQPARLVADDQRHEHRRLLVRRAGQREAAVLLGRPRAMFSLMTSVSRVRRTCAAKPVSRSGSESIVDPLPVLVDVGIVNQVRLRVVDADAQVGVVEDLADLVADGVVDALHVELGGERLLHAVDDRELGGALLALP